MKTLLLAAGLGSRLKPITNQTPKCLVKVGGKPLLQYWLDALTPNLVSDIIINTHYLAEKVDQFIASLDKEKYPPIHTHYEHELRGTAGTLNDLKPALRETTTLVAHADNLCFFKLQDFINQHHKRPLGCIMTMMTFETNSPQSCGIVEVNNKGIVEKFYEKVSNPPSNLANGAVFILEPEVFKFLDEINNPIDISIDLIPKLLGRIYTYHNNIYNRDIGTIESLTIANADISKTMKYKNFLS